MLVNPAFLTKNRDSFFHNPGFKLSDERLFWITKFNADNPGLKARLTELIGLELPGSIFGMFFNFQKIIQTN